MIRVEEKKYSVPLRFTRREFIELAAATSLAATLALARVERVFAAGGDGPENPLQTDFYQSRPGDGIAGKEKWFAMNFSGDYPLKEVSVTVTGGDVTKMNVQVISPDQLNEFMTRRSGQQVDGNFNPKGRGNPTYSVDDEGNRTQTNVLFWRGGNNLFGQWLVGISYAGGDEASYTYQAVAAS